MKKIEEPLFEWSIAQVERGKAFRTDFKQRALWIDGRQIELASNTPTGIEDPKDLNDWLDHVEDLYDDYKYSRPSVKSGKHGRSKFRALSMDQLVKEFGHDALCSPHDRAVAEAKLEIYILLTLVAGMWKIEDLFAKDWFFQGADKSFILRKDMF